MHFIQHEAHRKGKRFNGVHINFESAFNTMSQAALWHVMRMFDMPDVDLFEQIYKGATTGLKQ